MTSATGEAERVGRWRLTLVNGAKAAVAADSFRPGDLIDRLYCLEVVAGFAPKGAGIRHPQDLGHEILPLGLPALARAETRHNAEVLIQKDVELGWMGYVIARESIPRGSEIVIRPGLCS